jgi:tetratricopeptide (TPR) repeat protein
VTYIHLGDPDSARRAWDRATGPVSPALRLTRFAEADLAALDARAAAARCQNALELEPNLGEAWLVRAIANLYLGGADDALAACREGVKHELTDPQRQTLAGIERLLRRHAPPSRKQE